MSVICSTLARIAALVSTWWASTGVCAHLAGQVKTAP